MKLKLYSSISTSAQIRYSLAAPLATTCPPGFTQHRRRPDCDGTATIAVIDKKLAELTRIQRYTCFNQRLELSKLALS